MLAYIALQTTFRQMRQRDGGPLYAETDLSRWIVEPWNTVSAAIFMLIVVYWLYKLRGNYHRYQFVSIATIILGIGGIGGTLYHAFRSSAFFLYMDWVPIMILCLAASVYFIIMLSGKWFVGVGVLGFSFLIQFLIFQTNWISTQLAVSINYIWMALLVLIPTLLMILRTKFYQSKFVGFALLAFIFAIFFRIADPWGWLPMGTHFLWHLFGAVACHSMFQYVYSVNTYTRETT